jgi:hypothetical protein
MHYHTYIMKMMIKALSLRGFWGFFQQILFETKFSALNFFPFMWPMFKMDPSFANSFVQMWSAISGNPGYKFYQRKLPRHRRLRFISHEVMSVYWFYSSLPTLIT